MGKRKPRDKTKNQNLSTTFDDTALNQFYTSFVEHVRSNNNKMAGPAQTVNTSNNNLDANQTNTANDGITCMGGDIHAVELEQLKADYEKLQIEHQILMKKAELKCLQSRHEKPTDHVPTRTDVQPVYNTQSEVHADVANNGDRSDHNDAMDSIGYGEVSDSIPEFNGSNITALDWVKEFEEFSLLCNLKPIKMLLWARKSLTGSAKQSISGRMDLNSWDKLKAYILNEFPSQRTSAEIHNDLRRRKKKTTESLRDYFFEMRKLGYQGGVEEESVIMYTINGIDDFPSNKSLLYGAKNYDDFKENLRKYEQFKLQLGLSQPKLQTFSTSSNVKKKTGRCFNCGIVGHSAKDCMRREKGPNCFKCNEFGHKSFNCNEQKEKTIEAKNQKIANLGYEGSTLQSKYKIVTLNGVAVEALIDTGSDATLVQISFFNSIKEVNLIESAKRFSGFGRNVVTARGYFKANILIDDEQFDSNVYVIPDQDGIPNCIIGRNILNGTALVMNENGMTIKKLCEGVTEKTKTGDENFLL